MRTIQEVGLEILQGQPASLYIMCGPEYGIKRKYIQALSERIGPISDGYTAASFIQRFSRKQMFTPPSSVYVIRYDEEFVAKLDNSTAAALTSLSFPGVCVMLYDSTKHEAKLDKYLPNYTVRVDTVSINFLRKYLKSDFPKLPDKLIDVSAKMSSDYYQAQLICRAMSSVPPEDLFGLSDEGLCSLFGGSEAATEAELKAGIAARNFSYCISVIDKYGGDIESVVYTVLSTALELEKLMCNSYTQSDLRQYVKRWTMQDVYNLFMQAYRVLKLLRSVSSDYESQVVYLLSLLAFQPIPQVEELL